MQLDIVSMSLPFGPTMHMREVMSMPKLSPWNSQGKLGPYLKLTSRTYTIHINMCKVCIKYIIVRILQCAVQN